MADPTIEAWTRANAEYYDARAEQAWAREEIDSGAWHVPESEHVTADWARKWPAEEIWRARLSTSR